MDVFISAFIKTSFLMSLVILAFLLVSRLLSKRYPPKWRYYTWFIITIGLLIPFKPDLGFAIPKLQVNSILETTTAALQSNAPSLLTGFNGKNISDNSFQAVPPQATPLQVPIPTSTIIFFVWLMGALCIVIYQIIRYKNFIYHVKRWSEKISDEKVIVSYQHACGKLGLYKKHPRLASCRLVSSPLLTGFITPTILLPQKSIASEELELILLHELTHYKYKDLWLKALLTFTCALHWFNPVVYLMLGAVQSDCEIACDETVLSVSGGKHRRLYGEAIIGAIAKQLKFKTAFSTYFTGGKEDMKRRLTSIMDSNGKNKMLAVFCSTLFFIATFASGTVLAEAKAPVLSTGDITAEKAVELGLIKTAGGTVVHCQLDFEEGIKVYEIEIINGNMKYDMDVGIQDSKIYNLISKTIDTNSLDYPSPNDITSDLAKEIALKKSNGGTVTKWELDYENNQKIYEIEIINGENKYNMDVAAADGSLFNFNKTVMANAKNKNNTIISTTDITADSAKEIALARTGGGTVVKCEPDYENGIKVYEIKIVNGNTRYDMDVTTADGLIRDFEEKTVYTSKDTSQVATTKITAEQAKKIALAKTGAGTVVKCKFDYDDGRQVYEIEIRDGQVEYDLEIDATSGKIIEFEKDWEH